MQFWSSLKLFEYQSFFEIKLWTNICICFKTWSKIYSLSVMQLEKSFSFQILSIWRGLPLSLYHALIFIDILFKMICLCYLITFNVSRHGGGLGIIVNLSSLPVITADMMTMLFFIATMFQLMNLTLKKVSKANVSGTIIQIYKFWHFWRNLLTIWRSQNAGRHASLVRILSLIWGSRMDATAIVAMSWMLSKLFLQMNVTWFVAVTPMRFVVVRIEWMYIPWRELLHSMEI